ncbi:MFS transporter [Haematobacter genomosp. 1]|uniref:MFS transporter n=2 Tax=Haematobacter genomosp. 1 TaxID=366618 RepID=A0A212AFC2_9RHOB|nr:MFS transporter [Haematobacter genomosp. 1]
MTMTKDSTASRGLGMVAILCWAAVVLDGFDLVVLGALIPTMTDPAGPWMSTAQATAISTASLVGMTLGALSIGWATDRIGRRKAMLWAVGFFSVMTLGCAIAATPFQLGAFRFLAGFGLGGCLPTAIALVTEFSRGKAGKASTTVMTGYHVGAVATAILGLILLAPFGWRAMFLAGAIPGFVLIPLMMKWLPESPAFLLSQGRRAEAERIADAYGLTLSEPPPKAERVSPGKLIGPGFLRNSLAIWVTSFMGLLLVYGLNTWLPALMVAADYGLQRGLWFLLLLNVGAIVGLIVAGRVGDAIGLKRAACLWFFAGAVLLALLAIRMPLSLLYPVVFLTGCFVFSAQVLVYAFTAANHPPEVRATAIGLSAGVGRLGAIMGPLLGGMLVGLGLGHPWGFFIFAAVGLVGALALSLSVVRVYR